jgi:hypothetical protein
MKQIFFYVTAALFFILLNGCCHKKYCEGFQDQSTMTLFNFAPADVDSISIEVFQIGANGKLRLDSIFTQGFQSQSSGSVFTIYMPESLEQDHDYRVTLSSTNQVYILSGFTSHSTSCNNCLITILNDDYEELISYTVNGQIQYYNDLRIVN